MLIGIDVGTTAVKAALFDARGAVLKDFAQSYPTRRAALGHVEQNPQDWMDLVLRALSFLGDEQNVTAVGLTSQVNTHVFVDEKGEPLLPAMTWQDTRCAADAAALDAQVDVEDKLRWWNAPLPIDSSHVLARMDYVKRNQPELWHRTRWVMAPKDFCIFKLTGEVTADPMTCFASVDQSLQLIAALIDHVPGSAQRLPPISGFTSPAGHIKPGLPCAGATMVVGAMDAWAGLFGAGVCEEGQGLYLSGTSEILGLVSHKRVPTPGVITFATCEGLVLHAGPTQSGGASVAWLSRLLSRTPQEISQLAETADLAHVPLFLPHLDGERAPLWDPQARGSFTGLTSASGAAELCRAVLDGVAYSARLVFERLEISGATRPTAIHHAGGGSASDLWCQIRADVLGCPVLRARTLDAGVLGAALMAGVGCGLFPPLKEATRNFVPMERRFNPTDGSRHTDRFALYKDTYQRLKH